MEVKQGARPAIKLTKWIKEPTIENLKADLESAKPSHDLQVAKIKRWNNLRNVEGPARPKTIKGRSSVQPKLIRRQAEWRYSALSEPFLGSEKLFEAEPRTFEDLDAARQNETLLNWQAQTKINKVKFIDEYVRSCTNEGTVIVRTGWIRRTRMNQIEAPVYEYTVPAPEEIQAIQQAIQIKEQDPNAYLNLPEDLRASVDYTTENNRPAVARKIGIQMVEEEEITDNRPTIQIMNPENVFIDPSCEGDFDKAGYVIVSFETSKAELIADGRYKNLSSVLWSSQTVLGTPDHASSTPQDYDQREDLRRRVVAYEYWGLQDIEGNDSLVPIVATWIGNVLIRLEENPFPDGKPPFILVPYLPVERQLYGEPDAEILEDNQRILGAVTRGMIDLMGRSANAQQGFAKGFLDVTNKRRFESGQDYDFNPGTDPRMSIFQHTYPEIPQSAMLMMQLQNQEAEALTGVKSFSGGVSGEAYGDVAAGIRGVLDAASKREMNILRRLAKGIQDIGTKLMMMNQSFLSDEEVVRVTNEEYVAIRREDLKGNFDIIVDIATAEVDEKKAQDLGFMLQTMGPNMDFSMVQLILAEIARLKRMPHLAEMIKQFQPKPDPMTEELKKAELQKLQAEVSKLQAEAELAVARVEEVKANAAKARVEAANEISGVTHERDLQKQTSQAKGNQQLEVTKALLAPKKEGEKKGDITAAVGFNELSQIMNQPKKTPNVMNIASGSYDPNMDPALNQRIGL